MSLVCKFKRSLVQLDDLLISITADVGRVARISQDLGEAYINQHLALVRPIPEMNSEYLAMCIASQNVGIKQIEELKRGATKAGLGLDDIRSLAIPLPSLEEQTEIVRLVEQHFALADTLEKHLANAKQRMDNLTQSILTKAFKGELVPQDPNDEPADKLLTRIKAARLEAEKLEKVVKKAANANVKKGN
jgi:type I restriction enzyme S subunit